MFQSTIPDSDISSHQIRIRTEYIQAQRQISIAGLRQILGNTFIEIGGRIYGATKSSCEDAAEVSGHLRSVVRSPDLYIQAITTP